jgi:hypothetical protein
MLNGERLKKALKKTFFILFYFPFFILFYFSFFILFYFPFFILFYWRLNSSKSHTRRYAQSPFRNGRLSGSSH